MTESSGGPVCAAIARPSGTFALVAIDHREILRALLAGAGKDAADADVSRFVVDVVRCLSPLASGVLVDPLFGVTPVVRETAIDRGCGLMLSVERIVDGPDDPLQDTVLDESLLREEIVRLGVKAFKFLVMWRPKERSSLHAGDIRTFIARCRELGVASILEGLVPTASLSREEIDSAILSAAEDLASYEPDIYKGQLPTLGYGTPSEIEAASRAIVARLTCPWVVLSGGVPVEAFPVALAAACRAGASGFLAGRGIWGPSVGVNDVQGHLATVAADRLAELVRIVDEFGRGWIASSPAAESGATSTNAWP